MPPARGSLATKILEAMVGKPEAYRMVLRQSRSDRLIWSPSYCVLFRMNRARP